MWNSCFLSLWNSPQVCELGWTWPDRNKMCPCELGGRKDVSDEEVAVTKAARKLSAGYLINKLLIKVFISCEDT